MGKLSVVSSRQALERFGEVCAAKGLSMKSVIESRVMAYCYEHSDAAKRDWMFGEPKKERAPKNPDSKHFQIHLDDTLHGKFSVITANLGTGVSEVVREWLEDLDYVGRLAPSPARASTKPRLQRKAGAIYVQHPHEEVQPLPLPKVKPSYTAAPDFLLTNLTPPNSTHKKVSDYELVCFPKSKLHFAVTGEILGQAELSVWLALMNVADQSYMSGICADDILDVLNRSKSRGRETYVALKKTLIRMSRTWIMITDREKNLLRYSGPMVTVSDYEGDGKGRGGYTETIEVNGIKKEVIIGRLDRYNLYIPVEIIRLHAEKEWSYIPLATRWMDLSEMARKLSSFFAPNSPVLGNQGYESTYDSLRAALGKKDMRMTQFVEDVRKALNELVAIGNPHKGGITRWSEKEFKVGGAGILVFRKVAVANQAVESSE